MSDWHRVGGPDEIGPDSVKRVVAGDKVIALVRTSNGYCALDNACPHAGGPLSEGSIENGLIVCPWHGREYNLATGECEGFAPVATYPVELRADGIYVSI